MPMRPSIDLVSIIEASIQTNIEASIEPRHGSIEARCGGIKEANIEETRHGSLETRCGTIEEANIGFLEGGEKGCVET